MSSKLHTQKSKYRGILTLVMMLLLSFGSQILSLFRSAVLAAQFGLSVEMDAYNFSNSIASFFVSFVSTGVITTVVPKYIEKSDKKSTNSFITLIYGVLVCLVGAFLWIYEVLGQNIWQQNATFADIVTTIMPLVLLANLIYSVTHITTAFFQSCEKYNIPKASNLIINVSVLFFIWFYNELTVTTFVFIVASGLIINALIDIFVALRMGWRYKPSFSFRSNEMKNMLRFFFPVLLSSGIYQLSLLIDSVLASGLETGSLTALSYSGQISNIINTVMVVNIATYCYPKVIKKIKEQDKGQKYLWNAITFFHYVMCFIICCFACVGKDVLGIFFERGNFDSKATEMVFSCALIYIFGQQANIVRDMLYRYFYARENTRIVSFNSILVTVVKIGVSLVLTQFYGLYGLVLGTVIASFVSLIGITIQFKIKFGFEVKYRHVLLRLLANECTMVAVFTTVTITKQLLHMGNGVLSISLYLCEIVVLYGVSLFFNKSLITQIKNI